MRLEASTFVDNAAGFEDGGAVLLWETMATVEDCRFDGSMAPVAFVGVDGGVVRGNTMIERAVCMLIARRCRSGTVTGMVPASSPSRMRCTLRAMRPFVNPWMPWNTQTVPAIHWPMTAAIYSPI